MNSIEQLTFADHISVATSSGYCSPDDSTSNLSEYSSNSSVSSRSSRSSSISSIKSSISSKTKLLNKMLKKLIKNKKNGEEFYESEQEFECMTCARFDLTDSRVTKCHCLDWETESRRNQKTFFVWWNRTTNWRKSQSSSLFCNVLFEKTR